MGGLAIFCSVVMLAMLYLGLYHTIDPDPHERMMGICTLLWAVTALYLFVFHWILVPRHEVPRLITITVLSTAGYLVGRTYAWMKRLEWIEE